MPRFVTLATNTWQVQPKPDGGCTFTMHAVVHLAGVGRAVAPLLRGYLLRVGRRTAGDLKTYAETGRISDAKTAQRRAATTTPLDRLVAANAAFSGACGAMLTIGAGYWSGQLGEPGSAPMTWIGTGLLAYAVELGWLSGRGVTRRTGQLIACLDTAWVIGTVVLVAAVGGSFSTVGILATSIAGAAVGVLGWRQWRAARHATSPSGHIRHSTVDRLAARSRR